jgi:hypothetical protein
MTSFKSYFGKKHKYETLADLIRERPTPEEIIRTDPKDIRTDILDKPIVPPLSEQQKKALRTLLSIKIQEKKSGENLAARETVIRKFLQIEPEVEALINEATSEIVQETDKLLKEQVDQKDLENRLRALRGQPLIPYTFEEQIYITKSGLRKGGKKTRKYRKFSKRRFNKKSSRKNKKKATHKRKH